MRIAGGRLTGAVAVLALATAVSAQPGAAQAGRRTPAQADQGRGALSANVAGKKATASGPGRCARETGASLYDKPAALYLVEHSGPGELKEVHLTLWEFKDGSPSQFRITLDLDGTSHTISTLQGGTREGDGTASLQEVGTGHRISVQGHDAKGVPLGVTIDCVSFQGIEAEGG